MRFRHITPVLTAAALLAVVVAPVEARAQAGGRGAAAQQPPQAPPPATIAPAGVTAPIPGLAEYRIGPEDVLDISVWKNEDLSRTVTVRPDGRISLPLLNDVQAANLTPMELRDVLAKGYSRYVNDAEVSLIVREIHSFKVAVMGMVRNPGRYELRSHATVLEALALAGGLSEFAKRDRIIVFRHDGQRWLQLGFDYTSILDYNAEANFALRSGDIVVVP